MLEEEDKHVSRTYLYVPTLDHNLTLCAGKWFGGLPVDVNHSVCFIEEEFDHPCIFLTNAKCPHCLKQVFPYPHCCRLWQNLVLGILPLARFVWLIQMPCVLTTHCSKYSKGIKKAT